MIDHLRTFLVSVFATNVVISQVAASPVVSDASHIGVSVSTQNLLISSLTTIIVQLGLKYLDSRSKRKRLKNGLNA